MGKSCKFSLNERNSEVMVKAWRGMIIYRPIFGLIDVAGIIVAKSGKMLGVRAKLGGWDQP